MYKYLRHNVFLYLLILLVLTGGQGRADAIWCLPFDGQAHLENLLGNHCHADHPDAQAAPAGNAQLLSSDSCCGPCFDHATGGELLQTQYRLFHVLTPPVTLLPTPVFAWSPGEQSHLRFPARQTLRPPPALLALRSTVLRC